MPAIATRQSAAVIVDEKSVGKIPGTHRGTSKVQKVNGPNGASKGSGEKPSTLRTSGPYGHPSSQPLWPETRFAACSGRVADLTCLLAEYATCPQCYSVAGGSVRSVVWKGRLEMGAPIPICHQIFTRRFWHADILGSVGLWIELLRFPLSRWPQ